MKENIREIQELLEDLHDSMSWRTEISELYIPDLRGHLEVLTPADEGSNGFGGKLIKMGTVIFFAPLPIVSEALGALMIISGLMMNRLRSRKHGIDDIYKEVNKILDELRMLRNEILE